MARPDPGSGTLVPTRAGVGEPSGRNAAERARVIVRDAPLLPSRPRPSLALAARRTFRPPPPQPATTADRALEELAPDAFPPFADDLDYAGLGRRARAIAPALRARRAGGSRPDARVRQGARPRSRRVVASLRRFRELVAARLPRRPRSTRRSAASSGCSARSVTAAGRCSSPATTCPELEGSLARRALTRSRCTAPRRTSSRSARALPGALGGPRRPGEAAGAVSRRRAEIAGGAIARPGRGARLVTRRWTRSS